ncbi:MAG: hypothetical protein ACYCQI_02485 [Gammaproteobacteria bacterium]
MKKMIVLVMAIFFILNSPWILAEDAIGKSLNVKMDQAVANLKKDKNIPKAWNLIIEVSNIIKKHPEYDDGEYAEGINNVVTEILTKPWKSISPYLTGKKGSPYFRDFLIDHINELSSLSDLRVIKENIAKNCDFAKYSTCKKIITKVNSVTAQ